MGYTPELKELIKLVEKTRPKRVEQAKQGIHYPRKTAAEREEVLRKFHPDYKPEGRRPVRVGPNKNDGNTYPHELVDLLEAKSRIWKVMDRFERHLMENPPDYDVDLLVIGGGGAGAASALHALNSGIKNILIATKLRFGDANTIMAEGGIQAATRKFDSPYYHWLDTMGGGHFTNDPYLVRALAMDAPLIIEWLESLGVMFDKDENGEFKVLKGGGTSRRRMHSSRDMTGAEIMRTLRDEVRNHPEEIQVIEFTPAVEILLDEDGKVAGAILYNMETKEYYVVRAKAVIIATGGYGRLHIHGFATTNHYGATADGIVLGYRCGVPMRNMVYMQIHPTGAAYPEQVVGMLITEKVRTLGAHVLNKHGEQFTYPLEPRDVESASIIRECVERQNCVITPTGRVGVWLDVPMIDILRGPGTIEKALTSKFIQFMRYGIDIRKEPLLVYPTLHYQNGGLEIDEWGRTRVPGLFAAGEVTGGVHGDNRLMGNSLLDINVFGRRAGIKAAEYIMSGVEIKRLTLEHVRRYHKELEEAGIITDRISPMLLPDYSNPEVRRRQLTLQRFGTLQY
ncbi:MAG: succinate dehydrogenase/fumarate reductase flavoprotein subunit [Candidatus Hydrothermota bacterium]|nr:MAG: succinate dehydrogenase/fumarate reductase flavoprotein subunit [Candidatus Hydrothermae bacterium]